MELPDFQLVERAQRGDLQAFSELVESHRRMAFAVAYARVGDAEDARDVVQEAFVEAFLGLPGLQEAAKILARAEDRLAASSPTDNSLETVMERLSPGDRNLLTMSVLDGYSYAEIATRLQVSVSAVRSRIYRARLRLYQEVFPMANAATVCVTREVMERVLLHLTSVEQPFSHAGLQSATERAGDGDTAAITKGLAWLLECGEPLERAFLLTGALPAGLCSLIRLGRETGRGEMMFRAAAALLKVGLLQQNTPVSAADAANFFSYFSCILQAGIPLVQAVRKAGDHVPALAAVATDIADTWMSRQSLATALNRHQHIFTDPCISILLLAESTGRLDSVAALIATLLWEPAMT